MIDWLIMYFDRRRWAAAMAGTTSRIYNGDRLNWWQRHYRYHQRFYHYLKQAHSLQRAGYYL